MSRGGIHVIRMAISACHVLCNYASTADSLGPSFQCLKRSLTCSMMPALHRRSLLGGYRVHAEALQDTRMRRRRIGDSANDFPSTAPNLIPTSDASSIHFVPLHAQSVSTPDSSYTGGHEERRGAVSPIATSMSRMRRTSDLPRTSDRMPGNEFVVNPGGIVKSIVGEDGGVDCEHGRGLRVGQSGGGLARCQRIWKMLPQPRDHRPLWLRQFEVKPIHTAA